MDLPARSIQSTTRSHKLFLNLCKTDHISPTKICTIPFHLRGNASCQREPIAACATAHYNHDKATDNR